LPNCWARWSDNPVRRYKEQGKPSVAIFNNPDLPSAKVCGVSLRNTARRLFHEPLVHFLIAGAAIFFIYSGTADDVGDRRITVAEPQVARLAAQWVQTWRRPPSAAELDGLIRDYIKEELYYREGIRLGLDVDDPIIRRRIRSKMEFFATSEAENIVPDEAALQAMLDKNPVRYAGAAIYSFDQIYIDAQKADATERAAALLANLKAHSGQAIGGDPISLPAAMEAASASEIARQFGEEFASALAAQPIGRWSGPLNSGFGLHLVRVRKLQMARTPKLSDVRQRVENDWRNATREQREAQAYQMLLDGYDIEIERPK
jgi:peptidyl-prolyl cis-trans isomerase C